MLDMVTHFVFFGVYLIIFVAFIVLVMWSFWDNGGGPVW